MVDQNASMICSAVDDRLAALHRHNILDTAPEPSLDRIVGMVRAICDTPIALVSLVDADRQWFKAKDGVDVDQTPIATSVCALAIQSRDLFQVEDLTLDARTRDMDLVRGEAHLRFYAGAPLVTSEGVAIGSLCAIDIVPRPGGLTDLQGSVLQSLAAQVIELIELGSALADREAALATDEALLREHALRAALGTSEEKLSLAVSAVRLGTFEYLPLEGRLEWDDRCRELFGLSPGAPITYESAYLAGLHPDDRDGAAEAVAACLNQHSSFDTDYRTIGIEDGVLRHIKARGTVVVRDGVAVSLIGTVQDVSEERAQQTRLAETEERLRLANQATNDAIWDWDLRRDHVTWNASLFAVYGHRLEDVDPHGAWWIDHIHPDDRARIDASIHAVIDGDTYEWTDNYRFQRADGQYAYIRDRGSVIRDASGRAVRMVGAMLDQSDVAKAQQALLGQVVETSTTLDRVWTSTNDLLGTAGLDGFLKDINPAWNRLLGWTDAQLLARPFLDIIAERDHAETQSVIQRLATGEHVAGFVDHVIGKDGVEHAIMWAASPDPSGEVFHIVGRDMTELRVIEDALRQSQKMEAVGQLTGGLAHDFNNLLAGISGALELMSARIAQGRVHEVEKYMIAAQGAAKRAAALTHRLLAFSRRQTLAPKPADVNLIIRGMIDLIQRTVGPSVEIQNVAGAGLWTALVDVSQLENALLNLCINARDAMPGGGKITIETCNRWLDRRAAAEHDMDEGQYLSICVTDTGTGMTADVIARAFDPFFTTKPLGEGTGLGLSMIYGFAKQSGGQVRIYSEVGEGSTVCVYLPRYQGEAEVDALDDRLNVGGSAEAGETVLVVDDEPTIRMLISDVLEDLGYTVIEAGDAVAGLRVLQSNTRIDMIVTDVGLPGGMNGRQMVDAARTHRPGLKVLFITGYAENALLNNGQLDSGMAVMTKPFAVDGLAARVREMISGA